MRSALVPVLLLAALLAVPSVLADPPVVTVERNVETPAKDCVPTTGWVPCPLAWTTNGTLGPGDDNVILSAYIDEVRVKARPDANTPPAEFAVAPSEQMIEHPVYQEMNRTWLELNESRPDAAKPLVSFESRPKRMSRPDGSYREGDWGLFLGVRHGITAAGLSDEVTPVNFCWDTCQFDGGDYFRQNETQMRPFPENLLWEWMSTDEVVAINQQTMERCSYSTLTTLEQMPCHSADFNDTFEQANQTYLDATPTFSSGFQFNRTSVEVKPKNHHAATEETQASAAEEPWLPNRDAIVEESDAEEEPDDDLFAPFLPPWRDETRPEETRYQQAEKPLPFATTPWTQGDPTSPFVAIVAASSAAALLVLAGFLLYHRVQRAAGLDNPTRRRVYEAIVAQPGQRVATLATQVGLSHNATKYHVQRLQEWGLIRAGEGDRPPYFPAGLSETETNIAEAATRPTLRVITEYLAVQGESDRSSIAKALRLSLPTVGRATRRLEQLGLITQIRTGKRAIVRLAGGSTAGAPGTTSDASAS